MWPNTPRLTTGWSKPPDNRDEKPLYEQRNTRSVPFMRRAKPSRAAVDSEHVWERVPLLTLIYDLAWATSFASLSANTRVTSGEGLGSYAFIFLLFWWIWVAQTTYDRRFDWDDWLNRLGVFIHLGLFCALAAFTKNFDLLLWSTRAPVASTEAAITGTESTKIAQNYLAAKFPRLALSGIAIVLLISRGVMLIQYSVRYMYGVWEKYRSRNNPPTTTANPPEPVKVPGWTLLATYASTSLMLISCVISLTIGTTTFGAILRLVLWGIAILLEMAGTVYASPRAQEPSSPKPERLATLVAVVMGEKINGIAGTFQALAQSPNFEAVSASLFICAVLIILFTTYLYFETAWTKDADGQTCGWVLVLAHFVYIISLIMLFEGVKNVILYSGGAVTLLKQFNSQTVKLNAVNQFPWPDQESRIKAVSEVMTSFLQEYGLAWKDMAQELNDMVEKFSNGSLPEATSLQEVVSVWSWRMNLQVTVTIAGFYLSPGDIQAKTSVEVQKYLSNFTYAKEDSTKLLPNGTVIPVKPLSDAPTVIAPHYTNIIRGLIEQGLTSMRVLPVFAGLTLVSLATFDIVRLPDNEQDKFHWGSVSTKFLGGIIFLLLSLLNVGQEQDVMSLDFSHQAGIFRWLAAYWALPTILILLFLVFLFDFILLGCSKPDSWMYQLRTWLQRPANPTSNIPLNPLPPLASSTHGQPPSTLGTSGLNQLTATPHPTSATPVPAPPIVGGTPAVSATNSTAALLGSSQPLSMINQASAPAPVPSTSTPTRPGVSRPSRKPTPSRTTASNPKGLLTPSMHAPRGPPSASSSNSSTSLPGVAPFSPPSAAP